MMVYPISKVIQFSFYDNSIINPNPIYVGLKNFIELFQNRLFWWSLKNTVIFTAFSVFFHLIVGLAFAVLLNQHLKKIALTFFRSILILPWIFTAVIVAIIWQLLFYPMGIFNFILKELGIIHSWLDWFGEPNLAMPALILVCIWRGYPFIMISMLAGLQSIPFELYEAAHMDGANDWQSFLHITLPQLKPVLVSIGLLDTIWTFRLFPLVWLTTGGGPGHFTEVLSTYTYKLAFVEYQFSQGSAIAVVILIFAMMFTFFYIKQQKSI